jgi:hypothetical protein
MVESTLELGEGGRGGRCVGAPGGGYCCKHCLCCCSRIAAGGCTTFPSILVFPKLLMPLLTNHLLLLPAAGPLHPPFYAGDPAHLDWLLEPV